MNNISYSLLATASIVLCSSFAAASPVTVAPGGISNLVFFDNIKNATGTVTPPGQPPIKYPSDEFVPPSAQKNIGRIYEGASTAFALTNNNNLFVVGAHSYKPASGSNSVGQLGYSVMTQVNSVPLTSVTYASIGTYCGIGIADLKLYCRGTEPYSSTLYGGSQSVFEDAYPVGNTTSTDRIMVKLDEAYSYKSFQLSTISIYNTNYYNERATYYSLNSSYGCGVTTGGDLRCYGWQNKAARRSMYNADPGVKYNRIVGTKPNSEYYLYGASSDILNASICAEQVNGKINCHRIAGKIENLNYVIDKDVGTNNITAYNPYPMINSGISNRDAQCQLTAAKKASCTHVAHQIPNDPLFPTAYTASTTDAVPNFDGNGQVWKQGESGHRIGVTFNFASSYDFYDFMAVMTDDVYMAGFYMGFLGVATDGSVLRLKPDFSGVQKVLDMNTQ